MQDCDHSICCCMQHWNCELIHNVACWLLKHFMKKFSIFSTLLGLNVNLTPHRMLLCVLSVCMSISHMLIKAFLPVVFDVKVKSMKKVAMYLATAFLQTNTFMFKNIYYSFGTHIINDTYTSKCWQSSWTNKKKRIQIPVCNINTRSWIEGTFWLKATDFIWHLNHFSQNRIFHSAYQNN